jgi:Heparan-alpha-glucosaminide N-acetyltransferase, catalytic
VDGLVAPSFILAAGFSMALTQVRAAAGADVKEARRRRMRRTLRRLFEVLLVGALVNWMWFPIFREPRWIVRMDILPCIGVSLLIALPILFALAPRPAALRWTALLLAAVAFGIAPLAESLGPPWDRFLNQRADAVFPLLPWSGYVYLGAAIGSAAAEKGVRGTALWLAGLSATGVLIWVATPWFAAAYPPHHFWVTNPANSARRWTQVCLLALLLLGIEHGVQGGWRSSAPVRFVEVFGMSSLAGYFFHQALLFKRVFGFSFEARWGEKCSWPEYAALVALLIACTFALTWLTDQVYQRVDRRLATPPATGLARAGGAS